MKTLLVATDFSSVATNAVNYAASLAKQLNASLILFNVHKLSKHLSNALISSADIDTLLHQNEEKLSEIAERITREMQVPTSWEIKTEETIESLKDFMRTHQVDLVVMGIESNLTEYKMFGNTTTAAIQLQEFPLLVVPNDVEFKEIKTISFAGDANYLKGNNGLTTLKEFTENLNANIEVLHVVNGLEDNYHDEVLEDLINRTITNRENIFRYIRSSKVDEGIEFGLKTYPSDMLVMIPHKMSFFESLFKGSHTQYMTVRTRVPLLAIPGN